jgi:hypothetical protein
MMDEYSHSSSNNSPSISAPSAFVSAGVDTPRHSSRPAALITFSISPVWVSSKVIGPVFLILIPRKSPISPSSRNSKEWLCSLELTPSPLISASIKAPSGPAKMVSSTYTTHIMSFFMNKHDSNADCVRPFSSNPARNFSKNVSIHTGSLRVSAPSLFQIDFRIVWAVQRTLLHQVLHVQMHLYSQRVW